MQSSTPSLSYVLPFLLAIFFSFSWSRPVLDSFCFELTRVGVVLTRVDSCRTRVDSCWTRVGLVLICVDSCRTRVDSCWTRVDLCWLVSDLCWPVLIRVDSCWYSCIRRDLIVQWSQWSKNMCRLVQQLIPRMLRDLILQSRNSHSLKLVFSLIRDFLSFSKKVIREKLKTLRESQIANR